MKFKATGILLCLALILAGMPVFSQEKPEEDQTLKINGLVYMEWAHLNGWQSASNSRVSRWGKPSSVQSKNHNNTFRIQRAFIDLKKNLGDIFSARVTTDVQLHTTSPGANDFFLKFAYLRAKKTLGPKVFPVTLSAQIGKGLTPNFKVIRKGADLRWINPNYLFAYSRFMLDNYSSDVSTDLGAEATIDLGKRIRYTFAITNGEGFKKQNEELLDEAHFDGKAYYHTVTITPIQKWFYLNFHYRDEISKKNNINDQEIFDALINGDSFELGSIRERYYGASVYWKMDVIKAGAGIIFPEKRFGRKFNSSGTITNSIYTQKYLLVNGWLNVNLGAVVEPVPLLIIGQFAYGKKIGSRAAFISSNTSSWSDKESVLLGAGVGWQFNKNVRFAVYYEHQNYSSEVSRVATYSDAQALIASPTSELFNNYQSNYYLTKDPINKNNVYLKIEVKL